jgi:thiol-disulfide isomerase/thioredoxin
MREERALPPLRAQIVERLDLEAYRGKFVILDFWVSWCGPCRYQVPALQALYEETGSGEEVALIGVSLDTSLAEMQKFLRRHQVGWTQVCDRQGWASPLARRYEVHGVPTLVLLDRDGAVIRSDVRLTEIQSELERRRDSPVQPAPERRPSGSTTKTL